MDFYQPWHVSSHPVGFFKDVSTKAFYRDPQANRVSLVFYERNRARVPGAITLSSSVSFMDAEFMASFFDEERYMDP